MKIILLIFVGVISNVVFLLISWLIKESNILEYGYSITENDKNKLLKKIKNYSYLDRMLLVKLVMESKKKGIYLYFLLINHWLLILSIFISCIGLLVFACINNEFYLMIFYSISYKVAIITGIVEFVPDIICVKSIRKRYKFTK